LAFIAKVDSHAGVVVDRVIAYAIVRAITSYGNPGPLQSQGLSIACYCVGVILAAADRIIAGATFNQYPDPRV
jgi:hypothetical protein